MREELEKWFDSEEQRISGINAMREEFEKAFPMPCFMSWCGTEYFISECMTDQSVVHLTFLAKWEAWQAATALQAERVRELEAQQKDMAMLIRRLCRALSLHDPDSLVADSASKYLDRKGLNGSITREQALSATARVSA